MNENIKTLNQEFQKIKNMGLVKSLKKGQTGLTYTFLYHLKKNNYSIKNANFFNIKLKCKLGYSKTPITLFNCTFEKDAKKEGGIDYIFQKYAYHKYDNPQNIKVFSRNVYANSNFVLYNYCFKLKVDYYNLKVIMQSFYNDKYMEDVCYWNFNSLEKELKKNIPILAIIYGYPYKHNNEIYYKYLKMDIYKLRGFYEFLKLIESGEIKIYFYLKENIKKNNIKSIYAHKIDFKIEKNSIDKLFYKIF